MFFKWKTDKHLMFACMTFLMYKKRNLSKSLNDVKNELERTKQYDEITGLLNRNGFCLAIKSIVENAEVGEYSIIYGNIRKFKVINELFGTFAGDEILKMFGKQMQMSTMKPIVSARMGSDHFAICVRTCKLDLGELVRLSSYVCDKIHEPYNIRARFGIYIIMDKTLTPNAMCDRAKLAKQNVTDEYITPYEFYNEEMRNKILEEQLIISEMENAIKTNQFKVYYQPIYDSKTEKIVSAEALVRWQHPSKGIISPGEFIPDFEKNGFIVKLDEYVRNSVFTMLEKLLEAKKNVIPISINISRINFHRGTFLEDILNEQLSFAIPPQYIRFEITESAYAYNPKYLVNTVERLRKEGFKVLIDDFGSGYSSFNTLQVLSVDILKLDLKFLEQLENSERSGKIIASIIHMSKELGIEVVAEGVETRKQLDFLKKAECNYLQGFYFSKAVKENEFLKMLEQVQK